MSGSGRSGTGDAEYRRNRAILLATNDVCRICGHPGSATADHVITARDWPRDLATGRMMPGFNSLGNLGPAHGTMGGRQPDNHCPICGRLCNQSRGARRARRPQSREWFPQGVPRE